MRHQFQFIDPAELARVSDLQLLARTVVEGFMSGMHRSPHYGASVEFAQYRPYTQGDDSRIVDWNLYARTDRLHVKQFHEETNLRCTLVLDCSASMNYGSGPVTKFHYARMLTACLAMALHRQKDAAGLAAYHHEMIAHLPPGNNPKHLRRLFLELDRIEPSGRTDSAHSLNYVGNGIKPRGIVVLISDLLHPVAATINHLKSLRARRHDVLVFQIADPAERDFPFDRAVTLVDSEDLTELLVVPDLVREEYQRNRAAHFEAIRRECLSSEIEMREFYTNEPLDRALRDFMHHRRHALLTSSSARTGAPAGG